MDEWGLEAIMMAGDSSGDFDSLRDWFNSSGWIISRCIVEEIPLFLFKSIESLSSDSKFCKKKYTLSKFYSLLI